MVLRRALARRLLPVLLLALLSGCAGLPRGASPTAPGPGLAVELPEVPFYRQRARHCGPAALAMVLSWSGSAVHPDRLAPGLYIPERGGTLQPELAAQARAHDRLAQVIPSREAALMAELRAGHPVLVLQNLAFDWWPRWHYAVVIGYDPATQAYILRSGDHRRLLQPRETFLHTWARGGNWAMVALPAGELPASANPADYLAAVHALEQTQGAAAALPFYRAGLTRWPAASGLAVALANAHHATGAPEQARDVLELALERAPENGVVLNNLALLLAADGQRARAEALARRAVALGGPHQAAFRQTLDEVRCADGCRAEGM